MEWLSVAIGLLLIVFGVPIYGIVLLNQLLQQQKEHFEKLQRDLSSLRKQLQKQDATENAAHKITPPTASPVAEPAITRKAPATEIPEIPWAVPDEDRATWDRTLEKNQDQISVAPLQIKTLPKPTTTGSLMEQLGHHLPDTPSALPVSGAPRAPGKFETGFRPVNDWGPIVGPSIPSLRAGFDGGRFGNAVFQRLCRQSLLSID